MMEVTVTVVEEGAIPARYTLNVFEDAPTWKAVPMRIDNLERGATRDLLEKIGVGEHQAMALLDSLVAPLMLGKVRLQLSDAQNEYLSSVMASDGEPYTSAVPEQAAASSIAA